MTARNDRPDRPERPTAGAPGQPGAPARRGAAAGRLARVNTGGMMYGTIVTAVALAVGSVHGDTGGDITTAMASSVIIYWLAHVYTAALSGRRPDHPLRLRRRLAGAFRHEAAILGGGVPPLILFVPLILAGVRLQTDVLTALGAVVAALAAETYLAGRQAGVSGWRLPAEAASAVVFGALIALLMAALHA